METIQLTDSVLASAPVYASIGSRILAKLIDDFLVSICFLLLELAARKSFVVDRGGHTQNSAESAGVLYPILSLFGGNGKLLAPGNPRQTHSGNFRYGTRWYKAVVWSLLATRRRPTHCCRLSLGSVY